MPATGASKEPALVRVAGTCGFMGVAPKDYAGRYKAVELNATFHDRGSKNYGAMAANYARLGLSVVVKVSGYATHDVALESPAEWWPWLREKYAPFADAGVLAGLLWQLPPSFARTATALERLDELGALLRAADQSAAWHSTQQLFEFRDPSWFVEAAPVAEILWRHRLGVVRLHVMNDTGWAGSLSSGWHGLGAGSFDGFVYARCFGSGGRSIGKYSASELRQVAEVVSGAQTAFVMFGQGDVTSHALENAAEMQELFDTGRLLGSAKQWLDAPAAPPELLRGRVVDIARGWDQRWVVDLGAGRWGYLGGRHVRKRGLQLRIGAELVNLRVEADMGDYLELSVHG